MSFLSVLPIVTFVLLGFALLGFCNYFKTLYKYGLKIELFNEYRNALAAFHNKYVEDNKIDHESSHYLLKNAVKIEIDSIVSIKAVHPPFGISTGIVDILKDVVSLKSHNFTETCQDVGNMLSMNIGTFENMLDDTRSKIFNPIHLVRNGISLILNMLPIVNLIPTKIKGFLSDLFIFITAVDTISSVVMKRQILLDFIRQIPTWISQSIL